MSYPNFHFLVQRGDERYERDRRLAWLQLVDIIRPTPRHRSSLGRRGQHNRLQRQRVWGSCHAGVGKVCLLLTSMAGLVIMKGK